MMPNQLAKTLAVFELWRNDKPSKNSAIPTFLRQQAVALLSHYSKSVITKTLRISGGQFKHWQQASQAQPEAQTFISLPPLQEIPLAQSLSLEITLANGAQLSLCGELNNRLITQVIEAIKA